MSRRCEWGLERPVVLVVVSSLLESIWGMSLVLLMCGSAQFTFHGKLPNTHGVLYL